MFTGFHGHQFSWYEPADFYASIVLWGFEGKELNRNVLLGNLGDRLRSIEKGEEMFGVTRFEPAASEETDDEPATGEETDDEPAPGTP